MVQHLISPIGFPALDGVFSVRIGLVETPRQFAKRLFRRLTDSVGRRIARYMRLPPYLRQLQRREARSVELLKRWLSRDQLNQFETKSCFEVIGCDTGRRYRISQEAGMNIYELNEGGDIGWCFVPQGYLAIGDVMLAQKIALESNERAALAVANNFLAAERR
jgi:hypothetical protein